MKGSYTIFKLSLEDLSVTEKHGSTFLERADDVGVVFDDSAEEDVATEGECEEHDDEHEGEGSQWGARVLQDRHEDTRHSVELHQLHQFGWNKQKEKCSRTF